MKMTKVFLTTGLASLISFGVAAAGYDADMAASYAELFKPVVGAETGKALHLMKPEQFVKRLQAGEHMIVLDVRTPNEFGVFGVSLPDSLKIPVNEVFLSQNLDRFPQDNPVVVVCKSGTRASAVGTALRHVGFENVYVLKGGLMALAQHLNAKNANPSTPQLSAR
jgi:rhodanese-related sulfurtransferase